MPKIKIPPYCIVMPFELVFLPRGGVQLKRLKDNVVINKLFKTKQSAINAGMNFMRYRGEEPYVKGNRILNKKKSKFIT